MRVTILLLALLGAARPAAVAVAQEPAQEMTGTLHVIWGDPPEGAPVLRYLLSRDDGVTRLLDVDESVVAAAGGLMQVNGRRMRVQLAAARTPQGVERARSLQPLASVVNPSLIAESQTMSAPAQLSVTRAYVTILCRFSDSANELPGTKERYDQLMGATFPGVNHYWTEVTEGGITLDGSVVVGWYTLPQPRSAYVTADNTSADLNKLLTDCIGVADRDVDFTRFHGINMQFNKNLDCCSWGGGRAMTPDGVTRFWGTTWEAAWAGFGTYAHEIGHSLGLPHSGGPYGNVYDSRYDVMSASSWFRDPATDFVMGSHTIGYHKDRLGVIPAARRVVAAAPLTRIALERSALPRSNAGAQLVIIPIREETGEFYTVESRRGGGYDGPLAQAVVIHYVNPRRSEPAQVVDVDGNGNVNDGGAQWAVNEHFRDMRHGITVVIDSLRDEQVHITVLRGEQMWLVLAPGRHVHRVAYGATDVIRDSAALQTSAGLSWEATTARHRAQVLNPAGIGPAMLRWQRPARGLAPGVYVDTIRVLAPGAAGHLALAVDSLIVAEPSSSTLSLALSATARSDSIFQNSTGFVDSVMIRFAGTGAATAPWSITKNRTSTIVQTLPSGTGNGVVRWYHWANTLPPGIYVDTITITAPGATGSPLLIIDTLHVHAVPDFTVTRSSNERAILAEGSTVRDSIRVAPSGRWQTAGTWVVAYQGAPSYLRLLDQRPFTGEVVVPFERRAENRSPGMYVDTIRLVATIPSSGVFVIDTMEIQASPLALQLSWTSRRDSVVAGVAQDADSVLVLASGPNAHTRTWSATATGTGRITLARRDAFTAAGRGGGTAWLRWFRNIGDRTPGLHVDTITVTYADTALSAMLVDSVLILQPDITLTYPVVITSATLRAGRMGAAYADTLRAYGGTGAITWSLRSGSLATGLALNPATGVISGVPEEAGEFIASLRAAAGNLEATVAFQLSVSKPSIAESAILDQLLGGGALSADDARFLDLLGNHNGRVDIGDVRAWLRDSGRLDAARPSELQRMIGLLDTAAPKGERAR